MEIWNLGKKQVLGNQQCAAANFLKQDSCLYSDLRRLGVFLNKLQLVITTWLGFWLGFFPFLWFSTAPNPGLKLQELVLLQLVCAAPEELAIAMGPAEQCPAPASAGGEGQRRRSGTLSAEVPKVHLLISGSASLEESGSLRSRINKNPVHQNQEPGMTWYVEGFGQGGVKGGSFVALHSCLPRKSSGFGFSCWIQYE